MGKLQDQILDILSSSMDTTTALAESNRIIAESKTSAKPLTYYTKDGKQFTLAHGKATEQQARAPVPPAAKAGQAKAPLSKAESGQSAAYDKAYAEYRQLYDEWESALKNFKQTGVGGDRVKELQAQLDPALERTNARFVSRNPWERIGNPKYDASSKAGAGESVGKAGKLSKPVVYDVGGKYDTFTGGFAGAYPATERLLELGYTAELIKTDNPLLAGSYNGSVFTVRTNAPKDVFEEAQSYRFTNEGRQRSWAETLNRTKSESLIKGYTREFAPLVGETPKPSPVQSAGSPALAAHEASLQSIESSRSDLSRTSDERQSHSLTIEPDDPRTARWERDPGSMDIQGIDTPKHKPKYAVGKSKSGKGKRKANKGFTSLGTTR